MDELATPYETYEEIAMDLGLSVEALRKEYFSVCHRAGKRLIAPDDHVMNCIECGECEGELPF